MKKNNELATFIAGLSASILLSILASEATGYKTVIAINPKGSKVKVTIVQDLTKPFHQAKTEASTP